MAGIYDIIKVSKKERGVTPMSFFEKVSFKGEFREYQSRVLDNSGEYLKDGKINIVAAPGSGKTVLGLELIKRIGEPCIILSPTTAIRQQWGERFKSLFLDNIEDFDGLFSYDLHAVKPIISITYQALYSAVEKTSLSDAEDEDCSDVELFEVIREYGIKTICLDEAHHLKNEWQKALEKFVSTLDGEIKIIALTATPPYDSDGNEWDRYYSVCGSIDEEIFVPELVSHNTLCPHQDYVYFNYPTVGEISRFIEYRASAKKAISEIMELPLMARVADTLNNTEDYEALFSAVKENIALISLLKTFGYDIDRKVIRRLTLGRGIPRLKMEYAERAVQYLASGDLLSEDEREELVSVLKENSVYEKKKVNLALSEKLKRTLLSSVGKLESIKSIVKSEIDSMGDRLRMLILTDYIKKENMSKISSGEDFTSVNVVSIFETVRRNNPEAKIGVLSGGLVILPKSIDLSAVKHRSIDIEGTDYATVELSGSNHFAVDYVGKLFESGEINILVGTKSLLGEGWDSPCINSLILASFVGSFVLSNQMRGRAIRIDKNNPEKCANIWHLVTVEPEYLLKDTIEESAEELLYQDKDSINSYDFEVLRRRFESFMGPRYDNGEIESGIDRLTIIKPPYSKNGIEKINEEMLEMAKNRENVKLSWQNQLSGKNFSVEIENCIEKEKRVPRFVFVNFGLIFFLGIIEATILRSFVTPLVGMNPSMILPALIVMLPIAFVMMYLSKRILLNLSPIRHINTLGVAVYKTLRECGLISPGAKVRTATHRTKSFISLYLRGASIHDQNVFNTAMAEMLSPIENPRYILIGKTIFNTYDYSLSFACPTVIGKNREYVDILAEKLSESTAKFEPVFAHREGGRRLILKCRKHSYITFNERTLNDKYKVSHFE